MDPIKIKTLSNKSLNKRDKRENNYIRISKPRREIMKIPTCFLANRAKKKKKKRNSILIKKKHTCLSEVSLA